MYRHFLEKYLIKDHSKINPNIRKLLIKHGEIAKFNALLDIYFGGINTDTMETHHIGEVFWEELTPNAEFVGSRSCLTCRTRLKFGGFKYGWLTKFCSVSCQMQHVEQQQVRIEHSLVSNGTRYAWHTPESLRKIRSTKSTDAHKLRMSERLKAAWAGPTRQDIIDKMRYSRKDNGKPYWANRFPHKLNLLMSQQFEVVASSPNGRPILLRHSCGFEQAYGRWADKTTYLCSSCQMKTSNARAER